MVQDIEQFFASVAAGHAGQPTQLRYRGHWLHRGQHRSLVYVAQQLPNALAASGLTACATANSPARPASPVTNA